MWNRINRSAPGCSESASASGVDSKANGSVSSERKNERALEAELLERGLQQSRRRVVTARHARVGTAHDRKSGVAASNAGDSIMATRPGARGYSMST